MLFTLIFIFIFIFKICIHLFTYNITNNTTTHKWLKRTNFKDNFVRNKSSIASVHIILLNTPYTITRNETRPASDISFQAIRAANATSSIENPTFH